MMFDGVVLWVCDVVCDFGIVIYFDVCIEIGQYVWMQLQLCGFEYGQWVGGMVVYLDF